MLWMWIRLGWAGCVDGACPAPSPPSIEVDMPFQAAAPLPPIDRDRTTDLRTVVFALG